MAATGVSREVQEQTVANILGQAATLGKQKIAAAGSSISSAATSLTSETNTQYLLSVLYYILLYVFVIFIVLVIVHYTITPVFKFLPGGAGVIRVPGVNTLDTVYWTKGGQPPLNDKVPVNNDKLDSYDFLTDFTFAIDLLIRRVPETTVNKRLVMYMADRSSTDTMIGSGPGTSTDLLTYLTGKSSMAMHLNETNDLIISFYTNGLSGPGWFSCRPITNIPLYTPFRITVVVEKRLFTVYLNNQQATQRVLPKNLGEVRTAPQRFFYSPNWNQTQSSFVQNLHVWTYPIPYKELVEAQPALATIPDFDAPPEPGVDICK